MMSWYRRPAFGVTKGKMHHILPLDYAQLGLPWQSSLRSLPSVYVQVLQELDF